MFTGIIELQGTVEGMHLSRLAVQARMDARHAGESISVNGVCLTLLPESSDTVLFFDVSPETFAVTNLSNLQIGDVVNLERAMLSTTRFGGHYVSGHVDTTAVIHRLTPMDDYLEVIIGGFAVCDTMYLLPKGSITLDGVSLTINVVKDRAIHVMLVPHTLGHTTLGQWQVGQRLNVEFDYLTRIIAHQLRSIAGSLDTQIEVLT